MPCIVWLFVGFQVGRFQSKKGVIRGHKTMAMVNHILCGFIKKSNQKEQAERDKQQ